jgi:hypothetical protein
MFNVDFTDELLKEKRTYEAFGKNDDTISKHILFPSIDRLDEIPLSLLKEKGLTLRISKEFPSIACVGDYKLAVLQRSHE